MHPPARPLVEAALATPINRRKFLALVGAAALAPRLLRGQPKSSPVAFYASVGPKLLHFDLDVASANLALRDEVTAPAGVQYVWPHVSRRFLYVASSDSVVGPGGRPGNSHYLSAYRVDATGTLTPHGLNLALSARPVHLCTDIPSEHALVAFNNPSAIRIYRINPDGTLGAEVPQEERIDAGTYAHQVRVSPDNRLVLLCTRGNDATATRPEDPGAIKVFRFAQGKLTDEVSIAPNKGAGFGPRHLDFHPTQPWIYVSRERENALSLFRREGDRVQPNPDFTVSTLAASATNSQQAGAIHVHPNGRFVYGVNRLALGSVTPGTPLPARGDNSLVVFALNPINGEPTLIQRIDTRGIHNRTFHLDPSGRVLVSASIRTVDVAQDGRVRAGLSIFRVGGDGQLEFVRRHEIDEGSHQLFWSGMIAL